MFFPIRCRCLLTALALASLGAGTAWTQAPPPGSFTPPPPPAHPVPILPALPAADDASFYAEKNVPHGRVEQVHYKTSAGAEKRMHVYLPPGYDEDKERRYPVLYLNHGGGENDSLWSATNPRAGGFAQQILDNLIAEKKAKPMIIVMPDTGGVVSGVPPKPGVDDACTQEYLKDIIPYVDGHYRTIADRSARAVAGLSMGGFVPLNTGLTHLDTFSELYIYSSGYWEDQLPPFRENFKSLLDDPKLKDKLQVPIYMAAGETDIALGNSQRTLAVFNERAIPTFWVLSSNGHEWLNWRRYLYQTAQIMFPDAR